MASVLTSTSLFIDTITVSTVSRTVGPKGIEIKGGSKKERRVRRESTTGYVT